MCYTVAGQQHYLAIDGGFLEVLEDHVRVLADSAEKAEDIDLARARADLQKAQEQLAASPDPDAARAAVHHAQARVNAGEHNGQDAAGLERVIAPASPAPTLRLLGDRSPWAMVGNAARHSWHLWQLRKEESATCRSY